MKTLVLTAWTENMEEVATITASTKIDYAHKHGYQYKAPILEQRPNEYPAWGKLRLLLDYLPTVDRLFWIDADSLVTNLDISLERIPYIDGLTASRDWGIDSSLRDFSSSAMILTPKALPLIESAAQKIHWANYPLWDQSSLHEAAREFGSLLHILPRRALNAVPQELHPFAIEPWQEGDFLCHLTSKSNQERKTFLDSFLQRH